MAARSVAAILLIVLGVAGLLWGGITYTHDKKVVDLGPVEVTRTEHERIPLPPLVGGLFLVAGVALLMVRGKGSTT